MMPTDGGRTAEPTTDYSFNQTFDSPPTFGVKTGAESGGDGRIRRFSGSHTLITGLSTSEGGSQ